MNMETGFLDGSDLYGSTEEAVRSLRLYDAGLVNISACSRCHVNALYYTLLQEHNRLAINLAQFNHHWDDERIFYEAKRILSAIIQHITYNEFLMTAIGEISMTKAELRPLSRGHFSGYSSAHKAGVYNEVALTALPIFLSMIPDNLVNIYIIYFLSINFADFGFKIHSEFIMFYLEMEFHRKLHLELFQFEKTEVTGSMIFVHPKSP